MPDQTDRQRAPRAGQPVTTPQVPTNELLSSALNPSERLTASNTLSFLEPVPFGRTRGCVLEAFTDNVWVTPNELLYANKNYALRDIASFQLVKINCRKSVIHKKIVNLLGTSLITIGLILFLGAAVPYALRWAGGSIVVLSTAYLAVFYWRVLHQKIGEYGLLIHMQFGPKRVITSHSLPAIQNLLQILLQRLEQPGATNSMAAVNMYTGDIGLEKW